ncbi:hypothetical protein M011DRAFT_511873 [Sporormia fimetaria CBS 119925]|uniref:Uncharacterized protein n=1 Tax=Sporormia fimetaria CBS 119925 TaxID=1340428 RepID=A0A6A6VGU7_9PLEO|nr:hypothetical protein M011DRAFT_511873 [Sporormia fimetaria CBS 119925]
MSRTQQDQFVDDEEEDCCPLCVEEFDLSDKGFRPCPCGYQICQFCWNNIKTNMNGLCPACRRPYDDNAIEFKEPTAEELAKHKQQAAQKAKKNLALRQKEAQKAEADSLSRKHLAGLRVRQKNLVYVTGLTPKIQEDKLHELLRGKDYFGQYGEIIKIVVSKAREDSQQQQSVGVYVTFARKEDAEACIAAVNGSHNGDRILRAQHGTTKYCSAYLRGERCNNRNCMFLHEPGEDNDSFTRQDLSIMNSIQTQQPNQTAANAAPPPHRGPAIAAAAPPMTSRQDVNDHHSPTGDPPGLPATASWGSKAAQERRASRSTIASNSSPMPANAVPAQVQKLVKNEEASRKKEKEKEKEKAKEKEREREKEKEKEKPKTKSKGKAAPSTQPPIEHRPRKPCVPGFDDLVKVLSSPDFKFIFSMASLSAEDAKAIKDFPGLLEPDGGAKRRAAREREVELRAQREAELKAPTSTTEVGESNEATAGGSLQLGGEPEERHDVASLRSGRGAIAPPGQNPLGGEQFAQNSPLTGNFGAFGLNSRSLTPQQQQQLLLLRGDSQLSNAQAGQSQQGPHTQARNAPGHARHASRFSFANDSSAAASVQPVASQKMMNQQSSMMPKNIGQYGQISQHQPLTSQFYTSGVQGPPPGLKTTGTPPVGGGGIFGQGHGFATGAGYGMNATGRNNNDAMYQELLRSRNMEGGARIADAGKRESMFPSFLNQHPSTSTPAQTPGLLTFPYGASPGAYQESGSQKSKKKGKKHRHANTSSSGGGGVVDVQDPSMLQARLHQGGLVGQGLYAGQGQGGFSSLYANNSYSGGAGRW